MRPIGTRTGRLARLMSTRTLLLRRLGDRRLHTGSALGHELGISRAAVHKHVHALLGLGVAIECVRGRGYRLTEPIVTLSAAEIAHRRRAAKAAPSALSPVTVLDEVDSTNSYLARAVGSGRVRGDACVAERQLAGRGRQGRRWVGSPYRDIMLSLGWDFRVGPADVMGLSLALGLAVTGALARLGVRDTALKWPNDVCWRGRKLAGVLVELSGEISGPCRAIVGVGVNVDVRPRDGAGIGQPWVDLRTIAGRAPDRNDLAAALIDALVATLGRFERHGFAAFVGEWHERDALRGRPVVVTGAGGACCGQALGVDETGALLLELAGGAVRRITVGDVSVRAAP